jgi:hypothetical protein
MSILRAGWRIRLNRSKALRVAIGVDPATTNYATTAEPHERGSILVAAVFSAILKIYDRRTQDLLRLATGNSGVLRPGAIHPDLVERLAREATNNTRAARQAASACFDSSISAISGVRRSSGLMTSRIVLLATWV